MTRTPSSARAVRFPAGYGTPGGLRPFWVLRPTTAYAWTLAGFPQSATRWCFDAGGS